jgi:hypothetical protein
MKVFIFSILILTVYILAGQFITKEAKKAFENYEKKTSIEYLLNY